MATSKKTVPVQKVNTAPPEPYLGKYVISYMELTYDGEKENPENWVIYSQESQRFNTYEEAEEFVKDNSDPGDYNIKIIISQIVSVGEISGISFKKCL